MKGREEVEGEYLFSCATCAEGSLGLAMMAGQEVKKPEKGVSGAGKVLDWFLAA